MDDPENPEEWLFDFSTSPYEEWIGYLFESELDEKGYLGKHRGSDVASYFESPETMLDYLDRLCSDLPLLIDRYLWERIDKVLYEVLTVHAKLLWEHAIPLQQRIQCLGKMKSVFLDYLPCHPEAMTKIDALFMWWDLVCSGFFISEGSMTHEEIMALPLESPRYNELMDKWTAGKATHEDFRELRLMLAPGEDPDAPRPGRREDPDRLKFVEQNRDLVDATFEILREILEAGNDDTAKCALHGLGHLVHPGVLALVEAYLLKNRERLDAEMIRWIEACRDGTCQ